jgi:hypothetical protein
MSNPVCINALFIHSLENAGNDLMLQLAVQLPDAFEAAIDDGWAQTGHDHWFRRRFFCELPKIEDPKVAAHVLKRVLEKRTPEEVSNTLLQNDPSQGAPARRWFTHATSRAAWRSAVFRQAMELGLDLRTEFTHSTAGLNSRPGSLLASFIMDAAESIDDKNHNPMLGRDNVTHCLEPIIELIDLGAQLDKSSLSVLLKHHQPEGVTHILNAFDARGALRASECLKMVSLLKVHPSNLAHLQSKAAMELMDQLSPTPSSIRSRP